MFTRRALLGSGAGLAATLAGCTGAGRPGNAGDAGGTADGTATAPEGSTLATLDVGGSPGERVRVRPPEVVLLDFWATWCAPCKPQMAELRAIREQFPAVHLLSITNESDEAAVKAFWREYDGTWPVAMDPELRTNERFDVTRMPTLLVFSPDGTEVWRHVGLAAADTIAERLREAGATPANEVARPADDTAGGGTP